MLQRKFLYNVFELEFDMLAGDGLQLVESCSVDNWRTPLAVGRLPCLRGSIICDSSVQFSFVDQIQFCLSVKMTLLRNQVVLRLRLTI